MLKKFDWWFWPYILVFETGLPCIAFAAIFSSGFGGYEKLFFASTLLLFLLKIDLFGEAFSAKHTNLLAILLIAVQALERKKGTEKKSFDELLTEYNKSQSLNDDILSSDIFKAMLAFIVVWFVGGWVISKFLFSAIWPNGF